MVRVIEQTSQAQGGTVIVRFDPGGTVTVRLMHISLHADGVSTLERSSRTPSGSRLLLGAAVGGFTEAAVGI